MMKKSMASKAKVAAAVKSKGTKSAMPAVKKKVAAKKKVTKAKKPMDLDIKKGGLHDSLGIPEDESIPMEKKEAALKSKSPLVRKQAQLAINMSKWDKK
jgi:hypothetical protein